MNHELSKGGVVWNRSGVAAASVAEAGNLPVEPAVRARVDSQRFAFAGLCAFTLLLYLRPNELFPEILGGFPLAKLVALPTLAAYIILQLSNGQRLTKLPLEMKMLAVIVFLGVALIPFAFSRERSIETLTDTFFKVVTVFVLMINLINTRERLRTIMKLVVLCGTFIGLGAIRSFLLGHLDPNHLTLTEGSQSIFTNSNELAMALDLMVPFAVVFALTARGKARLFYVGCAAVQTAGIVLTFSRGGFLGLVALGSVLLWKAGRGRRALAITAALLLGACFLVTVPAGYADRLFTIVHIEDDPTNSAQQRRELLERAFDVALRHPLLGVGIGNFPEYSIHYKAAHNSYLEIAAELGWVGFAAYLTFILAPIGALRRLEHRTFPLVHRTDALNSDREIYFLSIGLQAVIVAYLVCSFFSSSQYFWHLYYIVAYAVSLREITESDGCRGRDNLDSPDSSRTAGTIWKPRTV